MFVIGLIITFLIIYISLKIFNRQSNLHDESTTNIKLEDDSTNNKVDKFYETQIKGKSRSTTNVCSNVYFVADNEPKVVENVHIDDPMAIVVLFVKNANVKIAKNMLMDRYSKLLPDRVFVVNSPEMLRCIKMTLPDETFKWINL